MVAFSTSFLGMQPGFKRNLEFFNNANLDPNNNHPTTKIKRYVFFALATYVHIPCSMPQENVKITQGEMNGPIGLGIKPKIKKKTMRKSGISTSDIRTLDTPIVNEKELTSFLEYLSVSSTWSYQPAEAYF